MGGQKDGKQRRPKKEDLPSPPLAAVQPRTARRVLSSSGEPSEASHTISVKRQIRRIRAIKAYQQAAERSMAKRVVKNFKKKNPEEEEHIEIRNWRDPIFLIDGYNVIGASLHLQQRFAEGELQECREMLLKDVAALAVNRFNATVVFDANGAVDNTGIDREDFYVGLDTGGLVVRVIYAAISADEYIERETVRLIAEGEEVEVATNDRQVEDWCTMNGATVLPADWLVAELEERKSTDAWNAVFNRQQDPAPPPTPLQGAINSQLNMIYDEPRNKQMSDFGRRKKQNVKWKSKFELQKMEQDAERNKRQHPAVNGRPKGTTGKIKTMRILNPEGR
jgi:predicted RNA-binding protein with PIN domain